MPAPFGDASPRARSDVGLLINEHAAAGEGSVHFALLRVWYWNQHVVLQFLKHLQKSKKSSCITCATLMQQNQISLETGWYFKDLLTISAVLMLLKCKLSFQLVKVEVKIVSAHSTLNVNFNVLKLSESPQCSAQGRWCFCATSLRTILNLPAAYGISSSKESLFLNISSWVLINVVSDLCVGLEGDMVPRSRGFYFSSD